MRIARVEPLTALSSIEAELLGDLLEGGSPRAGIDPPRPNVDPATLVVYVVVNRDHSVEKIVAPASEALEAGMPVVARRFSSKVQRVTSDSGRTVELALVEALVPCDLDL